MKTMKIIRLNGFIRPQFNGILNTKRRLQLNESEEEKGIESQSIT